MPQYNQRNYNVPNYNSTGILHTLSLTESSSPSDTRSIVGVLNKVEAILGVDNAIVLLFARLLSDRIRVNDWLKIKRKKSNSQWFD